MTEGAGGSRGAEGKDLPLSALSMTPILGSRPQLLSGSGYSVLGRSVGNAAIDSAGVGTGGCSMMVAAGRKPVWPSSRWPHGAIAVAPLRSSRS